MKGEKPKMCFAKTSTPKIEQQDPVVRHEADASTTKNSTQSQSFGYKENLKTSPVGLLDEANTEKKTLLGE